MPARKTAPATKKRTRTRKTPATPAVRSPVKPPARSAVRRSAGFQEGDVVVDAGMPSRVGTVCSVVTPSRTYRVRFADEAQCVTAPQGALAPAPVGTPGPACTPDC